MSFCFTARFQSLINSIYHVNGIVTQSSDRFCSINIWYFCIGEVNHEYDYADGNLTNYASLDMTKVESKPIYQSLINVQKDLVRILTMEMLLFVAHSLLEM